MGVTRHHDQLVRHRASVPLLCQVDKGTVLIVRFVPLSPALGAEVADFDITQPVPPPAQPELRRAFLRHHLLLVRGQDVTAADHDRFVGYFGPLQEHRAADGAGYVTNRVDDPRSLFPAMQPLVWHNDGAYGPRPGIATSLWAEEVAPTAAPTHFANVAEIVDALPVPLRERARRLRVLNVRDTAFDRTYEHVPLDEILASVDRDRFVTYEHPVLFTAPHGAGPTIIASEQMTSAVLDVPPTDGQEFLSQLFGYMYAPGNVYVHHWRPGDVIVWDNIALHHARPRETGDHARHLRRQCIDGWYTLEGELIDWTFTRQRLRAARD